jgi:4-hydroxyphenylpyruvate dioxygenase-like putative hemolysin
MSGTARLDQPFISKPPGSRHDRTLRQSTRPDGLEFVAFASPVPDLLEPLFEKTGLTLIARHRKDASLYRQGCANLIVNRELQSEA